MLVDRQREQPNEQLLFLHHHRQGGRHHIGRIAADDEVDLVDFEELCIDAGHR